MTQHTLKEIIGGRIESTVTDRSKNQDRGQNTRSKGRSRVDSHVVETVSANEYRPSVHALNQERNQRKTSRKPAEVYEAYYEWSEG